jgi:hypothetical protein
LSVECAVSILRDFAQQLRKATINFVCLSIRLSLCLSFSCDSACTRHIYCNFSSNSSLVKVGQE